MIELLVTVVIIGVLSAVSVPTMLNQVRRARTTEAQAALNVVATASQIYFFDNGTYPELYSDIDNGTAYMDVDWSSAAPNYALPSPDQGSGSGFIDGMTWTAVATNLPAYQNSAGNPITCVVGLGNDVSSTNLGQGCN